MALEFSAAIDVLKNIVSIHNQRTPSLQDGLAARFAQDRERSLPKR
jgi:hypothetical protein